MSIRRVLVPLVTALLAAAAASPGDPVADASVPAPHQVNGIVRDLFDAWSDRASSSLGPALARVDLGAAENRRRPDREAHEGLTLLGSEGAAVGTLYDVQRVCDYLCGDDLEECHYEIRVGPRGGMESIGLPLAVIPAGHEIDQYRPLSAPQDGNPPVALPEGWLGRDFEPPLWPEHEGSSQYRLRAPTQAGRQIRIEYRWNPAGPPHAIEGADCAVQPFGDLTRLACSNVVALLDGGRLLLVSFADYGAPAADPVAEFRSAGLRHVVVRLGLKAQTVYGLLVETPGGWQARFAPRDYAQIC